MGVHYVWVYKSSQGNCSSYTLLIKWLWRSNQHRGEGMEAPGEDHNSVTGQKHKDNHLQYVNSYAQFRVSNPPNLCIFRQWVETQTSTRRHFKNQNIKVPFYQTVKWQCWHRDTTPSTYSTYPEGLRRLCHTSTKSLTTVMLPHICHPGWCCLMLQAVTVLSEGGLRREGE